MGKLHRRLADILKPHGLEMKPIKSGHWGVYRVLDGVRVGTTSSSPSDPFALENALHDLVKYGHLPAECKAIKLR